jgi:hypothetical protein
VEVGISQESMNSSDFGALTDVIRQNPRCRWPSGPVMKYVTVPPGVRSCSSTVAGNDGGPNAM